MRRREHYLTAHRMRTDLFWSHDELVPYILICSALVRQKGVPVNVHDAPVGYNVHGTKAARAIIGAPYQRFRWYKEIDRVTRCADLGIFGVTLTLR